MRYSRRRRARNGGGRTASLLIAVLTCMMVAASIHPRAWLSLYDAPAFLHTIAFFLADLFAPLRHLAFTSNHTLWPEWRWTRFHQALVGGALPLIYAVVVAFRSRDRLGQVLRSELAVFRALHDPSGRRDPTTLARESEAQSIARQFLANRSVQAGTAPPEP